MELPFAVFCVSSPCIPGQKSLQFIRREKKMQQEYIFIKEPVLDSRRKKRYPLDRRDAEAPRRATFVIKEV